MVVLPFLASYKAAPRPLPLAPKTGASYAVYDWGPALER